MKRIVYYSGGAGSFAAAHRVIEQHGAEDVVLLTADTMSEADDWYDFVEKSAAHLGAELVMLRDGRNIWELAADENAIPSSRLGFCTRILKREPMEKWRDEHCDPEDTICYLGYDWTEEHRLKRTEKNSYPWMVDAPLMWLPYMDKEQCMQLIRDFGLPFPKAYQLGLPHNNCLRFGCVKGGQAYWKQIYHQLPDVFERAEAEENTMREQVGNYSMLAEVKAKVKRPLPLMVLRERIESQPSLLDDSDYGSCSCFSDDEPTAA